MGRRPLLAVATAAGLMLAASPALAEAPYGYWGIDLLGTELRDDDGAFGEDLDDTSASLRLFGGYRANDWLGVEAGLQGLGRYRTNDSRFRYSAATISAMLYLPLATRTVDIYGRIGGGIARVSERGGSDSDSKPVGTAGLGLQFHVNPQLALRMGADLYVLEPRLEDEDGESFTAQQEIAAGYLGLSLLF